MTIFSKVFSLFPLIHILVILFSIFFPIPTEVSLYSRPCAILFSLYLFPLICFRVLTFLTPIKEGVSDILNDSFSPWWAGHQIQALFIAVPSLEAVLRIVPGLYTVWLRAWGSKIGRNVYWTPGVIIYDRNLIEVGNNVLFGERSTVVSHVITPKEGKALLKISKVVVHENSFVGAGSVLSPGVIIEKEVLLKAGARVYPGQRVTKNGIV